MADPDSRMPDPDNTMPDAGTVTEFYGRWARLYDLIAEHTPGIPALRARVADSLSLSPGDTVVEMGVGTGANLPYLRDRVGVAGRVIGVDITPGVLEYAAARVRRAAWENVHLVRADATRPPIREADAVLATFVVGMFDDPETVVRDWGHLLGEGGRIALLDATSTPRRWGRPANALFRAFVRATSPPASRLRYEDHPADVLEDRVVAAREGLEASGRVVVDSRHLLGVVRLSAACV